MKELVVEGEVPQFVPNFVADSLLDVDFKKLKNQGIKYIAFDADGTLVPFRAKHMDPKLCKFLNQELKQFEGYCLATNRITNDLADIASSINAEIIRASLTLRKPAKGFFDRVMTHFDARPDQIAMIGDKLVADIYGANRAGMITVWVGKNGTDGPFDRVLGTRRVERYMMRRYM